MNRYIYVAVAAIVLVAIMGAGVWLIWPGASSPATGTGTTSNTNNTAPYVPYPSTKQDNTSASAQATTDQKAVQDTYRAALAKNNPDNITLGKTAVSGGYALQAWTGNRTGGQALLKFDSSQNKWVIVDPGGGEWSMDGLVSFGVPENNAAVLVTRISHP